MDVKPELDKIFQDFSRGERLNTKELYFFGNTNDVSTLIELTFFLNKVIKGKSSLLVDKARTLSEIVLGQEQKTENVVDNLSPQAFQTLTLEDCVTLLNLLFILKDKLSSTLYEWIIRDTARQFIRRVQQLPFYESSKHDLVNEMTQSFLEEDYLSSSNEQTLKSMLKNGLFDNIDNLISQFDSLSEVYNFLHVKLLPILANELQQTRAKDKYNFLRNSLQLLLKFFFPLEFEIDMEKGGLSENRRFRTVIERQLILPYTRMLNTAGRLLNEVILMPSDTELQILLFTLLRRMYVLWGAPLRQPLFYVLCNLSLYSHQDVRQAVIFCYRVVTDKQDVELATLIENSQNLKFLKQSPFYSSKAYAYLNDSGPVLNTNDLCLPFFKIRRNIESGQLWHYNIICEKSSSLLTWQFEVLSHDIRFGLFKIENMAKLEVQDYEEEKNCKPIIKFTKYAAAGKDKTHKGWHLLKNGIFRLVFQNTYSYIRGKEILYSIHLLEQI